MREGIDDDDNTQQAKVITETLARLPKLIEEHSGTDGKAITRINAEQRFGSHCEIRDLELPMTNAGD
jgi:hypothetical protein